MKKWMVLLLTPVLAAALLTGCASGTSDKTEQKSDDVVLESAVDAASTVYGEVESIVGNEVTLNLGTVDEKSMGKGDGGAPAGEKPTESGEPSGEKPSGGEAPSGEKPSESGAPSGDMPSGGEAPSGEKPSASGAPSGEMPSGEAPSGEMPSGEMPSGGAGGSASISLSGETATYLLPVGMSIGTGDFSAVSTGMVLKLSLDADGNVIAASILS